MFTQLLKPSIFLLTTLLCLRIQLAYEQRVTQQTKLGSSSDSSDDSDDFVRPFPPKESDNLLKVDCFSSSCAFTGSLNSCLMSYIVNIGPNSQLNIEFLAGQPKRELFISLEANEETTMITQVNIVPGSLRDPDFTVTDSSWKRKMILHSSPQADRSLLISIKPDSSASSSQAVLKITQPCRDVEIDEDGTSAWVVVAAIIGAIVFLAAAFSLYWFYLRRRRSGTAKKAMPVAVEEKDRQNDPIIVISHLKTDAGPLTEENLDQRFPIGSFESFNNSFGEKACSICLEELKVGQGCRQLYCGHIFHAECIKLWLINRLGKNDACCPNCNQNVMKSKKISKWKHSDKTIIY